MLNHGYERRNKYRKAKWETKPLPEAKPKKLRFNKDNIIFKTEQGIEPKAESFVKPQTDFQPKPEQYDGTQTLHQFTPDVSDEVKVEEPEEPVTSDESIETPEAPVVSDEVVEGIGYREVERHANKLAHGFGKFVYMYGLIFASTFVALLFIGAVGSRVSDFIFEHPEVLNVYVVTASALVLLVLSAVVFDIAIWLYKSIVKRRLRKLGVPKDGKIEVKTMQEALLHVNTSLWMWSGLLILFALVIFALEQNMVIPSPVALSTGFTLTFVLCGIAMALTLMGSINLHVINKIRTRG